MEVAVLASGRGTNFQAIIDAKNKGKLPNANIKILIVNNDKAQAIEIAKKYDVKFYIVKSKNKKRKNFEIEILEILSRNAIEVIALAGFMRILSKHFVNKYKDKIINIHPSLLPKFPGVNAHRDAIEAGANESGCTVHFVDEGVDTGPIILQESIKIDRKDDENSLAKKILPLEHKIYPIAIELLCSQKLDIKEGKVIINTN
tara:strand:+ start:318 stop:923 length:606 start_codon:yes stop_codon:yes gene_type:complete